MRIYTNITVTFASTEIFYVTNIDHHTCEDIVNNLYVDKAGKIILDNNYEEDFFLLTSIKMVIFDGCRGQSRCRWILLI